MWADDTKDSRRVFYAVKRFRLGQKANSTRLYGQANTTSYDTERRAEDGKVERMTNGVHQAH